MRRRGGSSGCGRIGPRWYVGWIGLASSILASGILEALLLAQRALLRWLGGDGFAVCGLGVFRMRDGTEGVVLRGSGRLVFEDADHRGHARFELHFVHFAVVLRLVQGASYL